MKKFWIQIFVIPNLKSAAMYLRLKDENTTGADDEAADAIDYAVSKLEKWVNTPDAPGVK